MDNASMIISRQMRPKLLCPKVGNKVTIPGVITGVEEEVFIGKIHIDRGSVSVQGKSRNEFSKDKC